MSQRLQSNLLQTNWNWDSEDDGRWGWETLRTAGIAESARRLISIDYTLRAILSRLDNLGADGLHEVIRHERARVRKATLAKRRKAAAKRRRTLAAKTGGRS